MAVTWKKIAYEDDCVLKSLFDAQTILSAINDNDPVALSVAEQRIVGRITAGNVDDLTAAQVKTLLDIQDTDVEIYNRSETGRDGFNAAFRNGISSGIAVTDEGGINISWTEGVAFVDGSLFAISSAGSTGLTDNATNYLYILKDNNTLQISTTEPTTALVGEFALKAEYYTYNGDIHHSCAFPDMGGDLRYQLWHFGKEVMPVMVVSGCKCIIDTNVTNPNDFKIGTGSYFINALCPKTISSIIYSAGVGHGDNDVKAHYHVASSWTVGNENGVSFDFWDNGTQKTTDNVGKWYCGFIFVEDGGTPIYVYPQTEHNHEADAVEEALVYPPYHQKFVLPVARFIFRGGVSAFGSTAYFIDIRPFLAAGAGVGGLIQNIWQIFTGDSGSATATESDDSFKFEGGAGVVTEVTGEKLVINGHVQNTDTALGTQTENLNMGNFIITALKGNLNTAEAELTLNTDGVITVTQMRHKVDTFEDAASDDLVTLNGGATVNMVVLRAESDARTVVVKHGTGNIWLQGKADISLDDLEDGILLFWDLTNSKWFDIGGGGGGAGDVTAAANITDEALVLGDGGAKGIKALAFGAANLKLFINAAGNANEYASGIKLGSFTIDVSTTGNQSVTGVGFKPALVELLYGIDNTINMGISRTDGTNTQGIADWRPSGAAGTYWVDTSFTHYTVNTDNYANSTIVSLDSDGFTFLKNKIQTPTGTVQCYYKAYR